MISFFNLSGPGEHHQCGYEALAGLPDAQRDTVARQFNAY